MSYIHSSIVAMYGCYDICQTIGSNCLIVDIGSHSCKMYLVTFISDGETGRLVLSNCVESFTVSGEVADEVLFELISDSVTPINAEMKAIVFRTVQKEKFLLSDPRNEWSSILEIECSELNIHVDGLRAEDEDFDAIIHREVYLKALRTRIELPLKEMIDQLLEGQSMDVEVLFPIGAQTYTQSTVEWMKEYLVSKQSTEVHLINGADKKEFSVMYSWMFLRDYSLGRIRFARSQPEKNGFWPTATVESAARSMNSPIVITINVCKILESSGVSVDLDAVETGLSE